MSGSRPSGNLSSMFSRMVSVAGGHCRLGHSASVEALQTIKFPPSFDSCAFARRLPLILAEIGCTLLTNK